MADKQQILKGRKAVDAYRETHTTLHQKPYYHKVHNDHTPLLNIMLGAFKGQGFNSIQEFFGASKLLNIQELGFISMEAFETQASDTDWQKLKEMWH